MATRTRERVVMALGLVILLLACKKKQEPPPEASALPPPPPPPVVATPEVPAPSAAQPTATATVHTTTHVAPHPSAHASATASASASPAPSATAAKTVDASAIQACCSAINTEANKPGASITYKTATGACSLIASGVKNGAFKPDAAKTQIKALLPGVPVPAACQ